MKKAFLSFFALFLFSTLLSLAEEFKDSGVVFSVDFPAGWQTGKSDDPAVVLKLEKGKAFVEFSRLDSELSDYYLKVRVKERVESLRSKGNSFSSDIRQISLHGVSTAYYTTYDSGNISVYIAFFTCNGASYAISASGLGDGDFRNVLSTIRKPGEKIEPPKQSQPKKTRAAKKKVEEEFSDAQIFKEDEPAPSTVTASVVVPIAPAAETKPAVFEPVSVITEPSIGEQAVQLISGFFTKLELQKTASTGRPYIPRRPLSVYIWCALAALWLAGSVWARVQAAKFQNPKLPPPPKDVPPDFFFPFIISRSITAKGAVYNVQNRQKQRLCATFNFEHEIYVAGSVYGALFFHIFWSVMDFIGKGDSVTGLLLAPPGGRLWASMPEIFFIPLFIAGLIMRLNKKQVLQIFDSQTNLVMAAKKETVYCLIRDDKGREAARLLRKGGIMNRSWDFMDVDNNVLFTIKDDCPMIYILRKFFGHQGGTLRTRYGIFAAERRAGFVFLDPASSNRFQIHLDFSFARLANPAQMLAGILYIISREKAPIYPSPF